MLERRLSCKKYLIEEKEGIKIETMTNQFLILQSEKREVLSSKVRLEIQCPLLLSTDFYKGKNY